MSMNEVSI